MRRWPGAEAEPCLWPYYSWGLGAGLSIFTLSESQLSFILGVIEINEFRITL